MNRLRALLAGGLALGAWAGLIEPRRLVVRRLDVFPAWPGALDGLKVAALADFHAGGPHVDVARVRRVARRVNHERPDLVLLLGDYVDGRLMRGVREEPSAVARALAELEAPLGVWAVLGNHDWVNAGWAMGKALERAGVPVLGNEAREIGRGLWLAAVEDVRERGADLPAALAEVPDGAPVLLMSHDPDVFPFVPSRVSLTLAGHTHGGQVALPRLRRRFVPSGYGLRFERGLVEEHGRLLFVTSGVGESGLPIRLGRPPEAALLTLRAR